MYIHRIRFSWAPLGILLVPLSGCGHSSTSDEVPGVPVYSMVVESPAEATTRAFAAEIRPHHEALVGFRVPGKLLARPVELGTLVHKGDRLAQLDSSDLALEETSLASQLAAARSADDFPETERAYAGLLSLPLFPGLSDRDQDRVVDTLSRCLA